MRKALATKLVLFLANTALVSALDCFICQNTPYPRDCARIATCGPHEYCSVDQWITPSGNIMFNTGCVSSAICDNIPTEPNDASIDIPHVRSMDILTCRECCKESYCNNAGCGSKAIPRDKRGPYCFNCLEMNNPDSCEVASICAKDDVCMMYKPLEYENHPDPVYRAVCQTRAACSTLENTMMNTSCPALCCEGDYCNTRCGDVKNVTQPIATQSPTTIATTQHSSPYSGEYQNATRANTTQSETTTHQPLTHGASMTKSTIQPSFCPEDYIYDKTSSLCIQLREEARKSFEDARHVCQRDEGDLVAVDTHEKFVFIENTIIHTSLIAQYGQHVLIGNHAVDSYWIGGARTYWQNGTEFTWADGRPLSLTFPGWGNQQPNNQLNSHCVLLAGDDYYRWHNDECNKTYFYICEIQDPLHPMPTTGITSPSTSHTTPQLTTTVISSTAATTTTSTTKAITTPLQCEKDGYHSYQVHGENVCVKIHIERLGWGQARSTCQQEGGDLFMANTNERNHFLSNTLHHQHIHTDIWLGGRTFDLSDSMTWLDQSKVAHVHVHGGGNQCLLYSKHLGQFDWDRCGEVYPFICERIIA
ncbi:uncharacterized protein LOC128222756 [Mya arenaria]|uniref:uncharacterized protein LOC128222756 n=1 Tax=Mya arenaria TaxID=6604 RepID=UPI0022E4E325|nr:uncharacterized protein LOC128222756 [Mya arenaria]